MAESWWCVRFCIWCSCILSQHNKKPKADKSTLDFFGTLSVPSLSIERSTGPFSQIFSLCSKFGHSCSSPYNPKNNKKSKVDKSTLDFLVRWKGLEPPTYWFVASHSIQLSYQRVYVLHFLCFNTITQIK